MYTKKHREKVDEMKTTVDVNDASGYLNSCQDKRCHKCEHCQCYPGRNHKISEKEQVKELYKESLERQYAGPTNE